MVSFSFVSNSRIFDPLFNFWALCCHHFVVVWSASTTIQGGLILL